MNLLINIVTSVVALSLLKIFFSKTLRSSDYWRATVSPLASIIGSGFLVVAPLLWILAGNSAPYVLLMVVLVGYAMGSVIRFNIQYVEPLLETR